MNRKILAFAMDAMEEEMQPLRSGDEDKLLHIHQVITGVKL